MKNKIINFFLSASILTFALWLMLKMKGCDSHGIGDFLDEVEE